jgi:HlyD family secretion protein
MKQFPVLVLLLLPGFSCDRGDQAGTCTIQQGDFQASLTETGELQAVVARHIIMPFLGFRYGYRNKITGMVEHGKLVSKGDSVISLDPSNVMRFLVARENTLEMEKAVFNKLLVEHENRAKQLRSQLLQQEASYNMEKLELEKSRFDSDRNKKIQELEFQKAGISLNKIRKSITYNDRIAELDRIIQATKIRQLENDIEDSHQALTRLILRSPNDGILQIEYNRSTRQLFKTGDETYPNRSLAVIPDLRRMKVKSTVNEMDIDKIRLGQKVIVRLDAFPNLEFRGDIFSIGKLSREKSRDSNIKIFDIEVLVEENESEVLKPGMTVSCEIIYAEINDAFYVSNDCILRENGQYYIRLVRHGNVIKTPVETGPRNNSQTVIYGDFSKGQEVLSQERPGPAALN